MAETTEQYRARINQLKTSIENEPLIKKMRDDIAEGISKTGNRQADIEVRQDTLEDDFVAVQQDASSASPSGAEVAVARGSYSTLNQRLTEEEQQVTEQLAQNEKKIYSKEVDAVRPIVTFYLDDGYRGDYDIVLPFTSSKNVDVPVTVALINDTQLTTAQLLELQNVHGWSFDSHTANHVNLPTLTLEEQEEEMRLSVEYFKPKGIKLESICYPFGFANEDTLKASRKYFRSGLGSIIGTNNSPLDTYHLRRAYTDQTDLSTMKAMVDDVKTKGEGWLVFYSHSNIFSTQPAIKQKFFDIIDYVISQGIEIKTVSGALDIYENRLDIGDKQYGKPYLKVGATGGIDFSDLPFVLNRDNKNINGRLPLAFQSNRTTINAFSSTSPSDIPIGNGIGTLYTKKTFSNPGQSDATQEFETYTGSSYVRRNIGNTWGEWLSSGELNLLKKTVYQSDFPLNDFPDGKVTRVSFLSGQAPTLPTGGIGTLETNRLGGNNVLHYQFFYPYNSNSFYKRYYTGTAWSEWQSFISVKSHSSTIDFGTLSANQVKDFSITVPGVTVYDHITVTFQQGFASGVIPITFSSVADTITLRLSNITANSVVVGSRPVSFKIMK